MQFTHLNSQAGKRHLEQTALIPRELQEAFLCPHRASVAALGWQPCKNPFTVLIPHNTYPQTLRVLLTAGPMNLPGVRAESTSDHQLPCPREPGKPLNTVHGSGAQSKRKIHLGNLFCTDTNASKPSAIIPLTTTFFLL